MVMVMIMMMMMLMMMVATTPREEAHSFCEVMCSAMQVLLVVC